jgi:mRNA-degrading endonuclease RelE of RelBE toxin-antitoxin system
LKAGFKEPASNPYDGKELQDDLAEFGSYRIKRYRIVHAVHDEKKLLRIYTIGHRREIYDLLSTFIQIKT